MGCDWAAASSWRSPENFNPRTPVGCDAWVISASRAATYFNPRTPVGCDGRGGGEVAFLCIFQSTHPSGVRLARYTVAEIREMISIHAPQWGATGYAGTSDHPLTISIHAPQWGATDDAHGVRASHRISIHAPQWGATCPPGGASPSSAYFNPRTPVGCDGS